MNLSRQTERSVAREHVLFCTRQTNLAPIFSSIFLPYTLLALCLFFATVGKAFLSFRFNSPLREEKRKVHTHPDDISPARVNISL